MEIIVENIEYRLDIDNKTAKVIDFRGKPVDVIIPEYVECENKKYKVTEIGDYAFQHCKLISVTIPDSVTFIGYYAFYNCQSLKSINIPDSVTFIGYYAFTFCYSLKSITIPNSVTFIGNETFRGCSSLTSIIIPDSITYIGKEAFCYCSSLTSVIIPDSVTSIGKGAFCYCSSLTSVIIPDSVTEIGQGAFTNIGLTLPKRYTEDGRLIAYKGFNADMTCRSFQYEEGKSYEIKGEIECDYCGFHACTDLLDIFNYYWGTIGKDIVIHEVYLSGDIDKDNEYDSKVCSNKIEIGRRLTINDINEIINSNLIIIEFMEEKKDTPLAPDLKGEDYSGRRFSYKIPNGYEFECVRENEIILKPIKTQYPKTYKECCEVLDYNPNEDEDCIEYLIKPFTELLLCRNAYWIIAGKQMGLEGYWEPDWKNCNEIKYCLYITRNNVNKGIFWYTNHILAFPTEEMRDAFFENFKDLIEKCKSLIYL